MGLVTPARQILSPRRLVLIGLTLCLVLLYRRSSRPAPTSRFLESSTPRWDPGQHHALIATLPHWHADVWLWLAGTLSRMDVGVDVFAECDGYLGVDNNDTCIQYGLVEFAREAGIWEGILKHKSELFDQVNKPLPDGRLSDIVFLVTEKEDLPWVNEKLLELWQERPEDQKFKLVPIYHEASDNVEGDAKWWVPTGALSFLTISQHVNDDLLHHFDVLTRDPDYTSLGFEHLQSRVVIPYLDVADRIRLGPDSTEVPREQHPILSRAVIAGMVTLGRRDYYAIFEELEFLMSDEPEMWGYFFNETTQVYDPIDPTDPDTFKLQLVGEKSSDMPDTDVLSNVVELIMGETQEEFYQIMAGTDVLLLAWKPGGKYYETQASGGVVRSIEVGVPLLTTQTILDKYSFLDTTVAIGRPVAISEIGAVRWFRKYAHLDLPRMSVDEVVEVIRPDLPEDHHWKLPIEVAEMLKHGWKRSAMDFERRRREIEASNQRALREVMMTLVGP